MAKEFSPKEALQITSKFVQTMVDSNYIYGYLGEPKGDGSTFIFESQTRQGYVRVRLVNNEEIYSIVDAVNTAVPRRSDIRVRLVHEPRSGVYRVVDIDPLFVIQELDEAQAGLGVGPHTHRRGYGLAEYQEPELFQPGAPQIYDGSFTVYVFPFFHGGGYFAGGTIDMTSYVPSTATKWRWAKIAFDLETETLVGIAGTTEFDDADSMTTSTLTEIDIGNRLEITGVKLGADESGLTDPLYFVDTKHWLEGSQGSTIVPTNDAYWSYMNLPYYFNDGSIVLKG